MALYKAQTQAKNK